VSLRLDAGLEETERRVAAAIGGDWTAAIDRLVAECHPAQRDFVLDPARHIAALCGRGAGKTIGGMVRFLRRMLTTPGARCFYLAKFRKHAEDLIWLPLKETFNRLGFVAGVDVVYNETKLTATIVRNGARLSLFGADKPGYIESLRGQSYHEVGIDEAALHPDRLLHTLTHAIVGPRLLGALWLIGTPGPVPKGLFYETTRRGSKLARLWSERDLYPGFRGWSLHKWSLRSAIESTAERPIEKLVRLYEVQQMEIADQQLGDENPVKRREYDGEWAADFTAQVYSYRVHNEAGELWNQWDPPRMGPMQIARLPDAFTDWVHVIGIDPGYDDPTAINVFAFSPSDTTRTIYHRLCFERTKLYAQSIAHVLIGENLNHDRPGGIIGAIGEWPSGMIADPSHQMSRAILAELANVYSIHIDQAEKSFSYKVGAIEVVNGELIDGRIKVLKGSKLEEQLLDLQWDESPRTGARIERPGQPNHSTDSLVYARMMISRFLHAQADDLQPEPRPVEPPLPDVGPQDDFSALFADDYAALLR
jgi:hypothetical protein